MAAFTLHRSYALATADHGLVNSPVDFDTDDIRVALVDDTLVPNPENIAHDLWSDFSANEVTGNGYTTGGFALTGMDAADNAGVIEIDAIDAEWTGPDAGGFADAHYALLLKYDTGTPGNSLVIGSADITGPKGNVGGTLRFVWHATGLLNYTRA